MTSVKIRFEAVVGKFLSDAERARKQTEKNERALRQLDTQMRHKMPQAVRKFQVALKQKNRALQATATKMESLIKTSTGLQVNLKKFGSVGKLAFAGVATAAGAAAAAITGVVVHLDKTLKKTRELSNFARQMGIDRGALGRISSVMETRGIDSGATADALRTMRERIQDAIEGQATAVEGFGRIGLKPEDLVGKGIEQQLGMISRGFDKLSAKKKALTATDLFGDEGAKLIGAFESSEELMSKMAGHAAKINSEMLVADKWQKIRDIVGGIGKELTTGLNEVIIGLDTVTVGAAAKITKGAAGFGGQLAKNMLPAGIGTLQDIGKTAATFNAEKEAQENRASLKKQDYIDKTRKKHQEQLQKNFISDQINLMGVGMAMAGFGGGEATLTPESKRQQAIDRNASAARQQMGVFQRLQSGGQMAGQGLRGIGGAIGGLFNQAAPAIQGAAGMIGGSVPGQGQQQAFAGIGVRGVGQAALDVRNENAQISEDKKQTTILQQIAEELKRRNSGPASTVGNAAAKVGGTLSKVWKGVIGG